MSDPVSLQIVHDIRVDPRRLKQASRAALRQCFAEEGNCLTIVITNADALRQLNQRHRQIDGATDVLSFPAADAPVEIAESARYLGDILIAHDYVKAGAAARRIRLEDALCLLVIHGTLHLLGFTHGAAGERERMWQAQARALESMKIDPGIVKAYEGLQDAQ